MRIPFGVERWDAENTDKRGILLNTKITKDAQSESFFSSSVDISCCLGSYLSNIGQGNI